MRGPLLVIVTALAACSTARVPEPPYHYLMRIEMWNPDRAEWLWASCAFFAATTAETWSRADPASEHANYRQVLYISGGGWPHFAEFSCPLPPPWPREDALQVRNDLRLHGETLSARLRCGVSANEEVPTVEVLARGVGAVVPGDAFVRVRALHTEQTPEADARSRSFEHQRPTGTPDYLDREPRKRLVGKRLPVDEVALVYSKHRSCLAWLDRTPEGARVGDRIRVTRQDESFNFEILAAGGSELFFEDLGTSLLVPPNEPKH